MVANIAQRGTVGCKASPSTRAVRPSGLDDAIDSKALGLLESLEALEHALVRAGRHPVIGGFVMPQTAQDIFYGERIVRLDAMIAPDGVFEFRY